MHKVLAFDFPNADFAAAGLSVGDVISALLSKYGEISTTKPDHSRRKHQEN